MLNLIGWTTFTGVITLGMMGMNLGGMEPLLRYLGL